MPGAVCETTYGAPNFATLSQHLARDGGWLIERAIRTWAAQLGVTPEEWLKRWHPFLRQEFGSDMSVRLVVEAKAIEQAESAYEPDPVESEE